MLATFQSDQLPTVLNPSLRSSAIAIVFQRVFQSSPNTRMKFAVR